MKKILLIGGTGFVGQHFKQQFPHLYEITATGREIDIRNKQQLSKLINDTQPELVINMAAITTVKETIEHPSDTYDIGFLGTLNLLTALKKNKFTGRILQVSSSEVYGFPSVEQLPIKESEPLRPKSPYAVAKAASEIRCYQWSQVEAFDIINARPFTHIGPNQSSRFAIASFTKQVAKIIAGQKEPILHVGNLDTTRDFTDVRDVVSAYALLLETGKNGETYNICSGQEFHLRSALEQIIACSKVPIEIIQDPSLARQSEQQRVVGDNAKLRQATGWNTTIQFQKTIDDMLECWLNKIKHQSKVSKCSARENS